MTLAQFDARRTVVIDWDGGRGGERRQADPINGRNGAEPYGRPFSERPEAPGFTCRSSSQGKGACLGGLGCGLGRRY
jgi:hypothetical protein